ncbi:MAG: HAMP domain-containing sensor histidine kinase, partial [Chloroflexota bacterium]
GIQFLASYIDEMPPEEIRELLDTAMRHGDRLKNAIETVLRYVDSPNITQIGETYALSDLPDFVSALATELKIESIGVELINGAHAAELSLSKKSLEVILGELIDNSRKFHPENNPSINIQASVLHDKKQIQLSFIDNGVNVSPSELRYICQPYYQSESRFTGEVAGIGLGLATVASVLWSVGGAFNIYNRKDGEPGLQADITIPQSQKVPTGKLA